MTAPAPAGRPRDAGSAVRFVIAGGANTALGYLLLWVLLRSFAGLPYAVALANGVAYAIGIAVSFVAHRRWTFRSTGTARGELPRFVLAHLGTLTLSSALMQAGVGGAGLPLFVCFLLVAPVTTTTNYIVQRRWVFGRT